MITRDEFESYIIFLGFMIWFAIGAIFLIQWFTLPDNQEWLYIQTGIKIWDLM